MTRRPVKLSFYLIPAFLGVAFGTILLVLLCAYGFLDRVLIAGEKENLDTQNRILSGEFNYLLTTGREDKVDPRCDALGKATGCRYTVILPDGRVVGDSAVSPDMMENHLSRPEVQKALEGEPAVDIRESGTTGETYLFSAVPLGGAQELGVLRIARPYNMIRGLFRTVYFRFLVGALLVLGVVVLFSLGVARKLRCFLVGPMERLMNHLRGVRGDGTTNSPEAPEEGALEFRELRREVLSATDRLREGVAREAEKNCELERKADELEKLAHYDILTGLPNRAMLYETIDAAFERAGRDGTAPALLFFDLDRFKEVNDTLGHEKGDLLLQDAARRFQATLGDRALVARLGGDEFCALVENIAGPEEAVSLAGGLLDSMVRPFEVRGSALEMSVSIGISLYPRDGKTRGELLHAADMAMYEAKQSGRAGYAFARKEAVPTD